MRLWAVISRALPAIVLTVFAGLCMTVGGHAEEQKAAAGIVAAWSGEVQIERLDKKKIKVEKPRKIFAGDTIITSEGAKAKAIMSDDSILSFGPKTSVTVVNYGIDTEKGERLCHIRLSKGSLRTVFAFLVGVKKAHCNVESSVSIVTAAGGDFIVTDVGMGAAVIGLKESAVVRNADVNVAGEMTLEPGFITEVKHGKAPSKASKAEANRIDKAIASVELSVTSAADKADEEEEKANAKGDGKKEDGKGEDKGDVKEQTKGK